MTTKATATWPNSSGAQPSVRSLSPPTLTSSESLLIANRTFFHCAENEPNNAPSLPDSRTSPCALPHPRLGSDLTLGLADVSSICYGSLPITSPSKTNRYISFDPFMQKDSIVEGCDPTQPLTLCHSDDDANVEASSMQLSHSHSVDYHHGDMSAGAQYDSSTYLRWVDELETPLSPLACHTTVRTPFPEPQLDSQPTLGLLPMPMPGPSSQFGATSSMLPIPSPGAVDHERNSSGLTPHDGDLPSLLYQTYPLAVTESATSFATCESGVNNDCYGFSTVDNIDRWISTTWYVCHIYFTSLVYLILVTGLRNSHHPIYTSVNLVTVSMPLG